MFRVSMKEMKRSANAGSSWSSCTIASFSMISTLLAATAVAVPMRTGWPARTPSPKKSPGASIATTASLPMRESTDSLIAPFWM